MHGDVREQSDALHARVRALIDASLAAWDGATPSPSGEPFASLLLDIARFQAAHVAPVARLWRARGAALDLGALPALPGLPTDVFRLARVAAQPEADDELVFWTSGTTAGFGARGQHPLRTTATYRRAALGWAARLLWREAPAAAIVLAPPPASAPHSSLSFMLDLFVQQWGVRASWQPSLADPDARLDTAAVLAAVAAARAAGGPVMVLGTSFAFVHLLDDLAARAPVPDLRLPPGSTLMQTGGFKGRAREVAAEELRAALSAAFGVPPARVVAEYGMTELSSQLYEGTLARRGAPGRYLAPPWMAVDAVDPVTLLPLSAGEIGLARFIDLCNVDSAVVVQTADRVRVSGEGVELLGRAPGAPPRGCSLAVDEALSSRDEE
jgi:hypothetical protein